MALFSCCGRRASRRWNYRSIISIFG